MGRHHPQFPLDELAEDKLQYGDYRRQEASGYFTYEMAMRQAAMAAPRRDPHHLEVESRFLDQKISMTAIFAAILLIVCVFLSRALFFSTAHADDAAQATNVVAETQGEYADESQMTDEALNEESRVFEVARLDG